MRWSHYYIPTLREAPRDAEVPSHRLLVKAGFIRKVASGIYDGLPLGLRTIRKVENIIREEMNRAGAVEVSMPLTIPADLWKETGRWDAYGKELLRFKDRSDRWFCLGPTHEEVVVDLVRKDVRSYRDLPLIIYQIGPKFRDEIRPRFGLMRAREFSMKDAYSFDVDEKGLEDSYRRMFDAYVRIFKRCGLEFQPVEAETGAIGGHFSHEFMVIAETGEDLIMYCQKCGYAANRERAERRRENASVHEEQRPLEKVHTPGKRTVEEVSAFLKVDKNRLLKTLIYKVDSGSLVMAVTAGLREINENKLTRFLGAERVELATAEEIENLTGAPVGFAGPVNMEGKVRIVCDYSVAEVVNGVTGANEEDHHFVNVNPGRDFAVKELADIAFAVSGDRCPRCENGVLMEKRGIEVGHTFKLGTKYSEPMECCFLDEEGNSRPMIMGCYGIGVGRTMAAAVEQNHDKDGIIWPVPLAPFEAVVILLNPTYPAQREVAEKVYSSLSGEGVDVIIDDRNERPGVKFKDSDLIGFPFHVIVGRKASEGMVEVKVRRTGERQDIPFQECTLRLKSMIENEKTVRE